MSAFQLIIEDSRLLLRRVLLVPVVFAVALVAVLAAPVLLLTALAWDALGGRRLAVTRTVSFLVCYAVVEAIIVGWAGWVWLVGKLGSWSPEASDRATWRIERTCAGWLWFLARRLFSFSVEVDGDTAVGQGPFLLFSRHVSIADTLIPIVLIGVPHGVRPRYVLKRELAVDPAIDILGHRLPNVFVARGGRDTEHEVERVGALADDLGTSELVAIYPEGTRFSPAKRLRAITRAEAAGRPEALARLERLEHTLPPHVGGPWALVQHAPHTDVVFCVHRGFDAITGLGDLFDGGIVGQRIRVCFERVSHDDVPNADLASFKAWLDQRWQALDDWIDRADEE